MIKRGLILTIFFLSILLISGCGKEKQDEPAGVSIVVVKENDSVSTPMPAEEGQQETEVVQASSNVKEFSIVAKDFKFTPNTITVNKGDTVKLNIKSEDTVHGISIPEFNVNKDIPAMGEVSVEFVADKSGTFPFKCSVYCGSGHKEMKGTLVVN